MHRRDFLSRAAGAATITAGMTLTERADALEQAATAQLQPVGTRVLPAVCSAGTPGGAAPTGGAPYLMGRDPLLPPMPARPTIVDFFRLRFGVTDGPVEFGMLTNHLLQSAAQALAAGMPEKTIVACLLHDTGLFLLRNDHGYWGADLIEPYVDPEISWAVRNHQALRFFPDPAAGYDYPKAYIRFFGEGYRPEPYIVAAAEAARRHRWYMTARMITVYDVYAFDPKAKPSFDPFVDMLGRHFRSPPEGLGYDNSRVAHHWRTLISPNNFL